MHSYNNTRWLIVGMDEVGRWPLAWPVTVAVVLCLPAFFRRLPERYDRVTDSKKLSPWQREYLARCILDHPHIVSEIASSPASMIDNKGIVYAIRHAAMQALDMLFVSLKKKKVSLRDIHIILDGKTDYGLRAVLPSPLETVIRGDQSVWQIAAASIVAKVQRDEWMSTLSTKKKYRDYDFARHKGYGTLMHREAILAYGLSDQHRKSFCQRIV